MANSFKLYEISLLLRVRELRNVRSSNCSSLLCYVFSANMVVIVCLRNKLAFICTGKKIIQFIPIKLTEKNVRRQMNQNKMAFYRIKFLSSGKMFNHGKMDEIFMSIKFPQVMKLCRRMKSMVINFVKVCFIG